MATQQELDTLATSLGLKRSQFGAPTAQNPDALTPAEFQYLQAGGTFRHPVNPFTTTKANQLYDITTLSGSHLYPTVDDLNAALKYQAENKTGGGFFNVGDLVEGMKPIAKIGAFAAGANALGGLLGGAGSSAGAATGASGAAAAPSQYSLAGMGTGTTGGFGATGTGFGTGLAAAAPGVPVGAGIGGGMGATAIGAPAIASGAGTLSSIGSAMSNADIAAALESGQYGGMTGALTPAEIAAAGGGTSTLGGLGSAGEAASSLIPGIGNNTLGSLISGGAALYAGEQGANASADALAEQRRQFDIGQANQQPWLQAGTKALGAQQDLMGLGAGGPEAQLSSLMNSPGYQFRLKQGQKTLEGSSAARGGMGSGKAMTGMAQYGQDYASNEYGNRLNQLAGLSGTGQTQSNTMARAGEQFGSDAGNSILAANNARQSGILGAGSALSGWLNPQPKTPTLADLLKGY